MHQFAIILAATAIPAAAAAQDSVPVQPFVVPAVDGRAALPANTEVVVRLNEELTSTRARKGHRFAVSVARDVVAGGQVVIPRGTPGVGEVTWRTGRGAFGKSGKMEIAVTALDLNGRVLPVAGKSRLAGDGNTGATIGVVLAAGLVAGAFVTGHSAVFEQGYELRAFTTETLPLEVRGPAAPAPMAVANAAVASSPVHYVPTALVLAPVAVPAPVVATAPIPAVVASHEAIQVSAVQPVAVQVSYAAAVAPAATMSVPALKAPLNRAGPSKDQAYAELLAAAQGVRGREPRQGWTISD